MEHHQELQPSAYEREYSLLKEKGMCEFVSREDVLDIVGFLNYLSHEKGYLLHGSSHMDLQGLEPRQANCSSKEFGNILGVYATHDALLPIFHAIINSRKAAEAGVPSFNARNGTTQRYNTNSSPEVEYDFAISKEFIEADAWSDGAFYVLDSRPFMQGTNDDGEPIDEWLSLEPVTPVGKIRVDKEDFPYFDQIKKL